MSESHDPSAQKRAGILDAATGVFLRYGFKKTSMDDLARAAGLSRQGLYLHFSTKEALFKEAVLHVIAQIRASAKGALSAGEGELEARLLSTFEALHGHVIGGSGARHLAELLEASTELVGPAFDELEQSMIADVARLLRSEGVAARWKGAGVSARELAEHLFVASQGAKHKTSSREQYLEVMRSAVKIVCRGGASS